MNGRRNVTRDIWRAVVMAGAMLGTTAACGSSTKPVAEPMPKAEAAPAPAEPTPPVVEPAQPKPETAAPQNPCADKAEGGTKGTDNPCNPCARPRGNDDDGPRGRGFILA